MINGAWIALGAAFILLLLRKWRITEWVQVHGNDFFSKMFSCDFCLSFWCSVVLSFVLSVFTLEPSYMALPIITTPITRILL